MKRTLLMRFEALRAKVGLGAQCFDLLDRHYGCATRHYHGWRHIAECLEQFDRVADLVQDPLAVELALWFHDAVYVIGSNRNEIESAELAYHAISPCDAELASKVRRFIEATDYSRVPDFADPDLDYLVDIDLSAFGKTFDDFWNDVQRLRLENGEVNEPAASLRRLTFYRQIRDGKVGLFRTNFFSDQLMNRALLNVRRAIELLEHGKE